MTVVLRDSVGRSFGKIVSGKRTTAIGHCTRQVVPGCCNFPVIVLAPWAKDFTLIKHCESAQSNPALFCRTNPSCSDVKFLLDRTSH